MTGFARLSIRNKLLAMVLVPLLVVLPLLGLILLLWSNEAFDRLLITKIRSDLAVARATSNACWRGRRRHAGGGRVGRAAAGAGRAGGRPAGAAAALSRP
jgi:hypothetical protein